MKIAAVVLAAVGAALPIWGGLGLYRRAKTAAAKIPEGPADIASFNAMMNGLHDRAVEDVAAARGDLIRVGAGVVLSAISSVLAAFS
ncbi:hypothetical protein [Cellulomonas sp. KRMCY2]|uniref:hypothetical protein n=1 Tax=Cellulomonas sp. KRMCY2 TaxID=1304865 RepID=UPI00045E8271|nr:hypothetical protein [Cellulomonas sp. KRMCY2]